MILPSTFWRTARAIVSWSFKETPSKQSAAVTEPVFNVFCRTSEETNDDLSERLVPKYRINFVQL